MAHIERRYRVVLFQRRNTDSEVVEGQLDTLGGLFAADLARKFAGVLGHGMYGDMPLQLIDERPPALAESQGIGTIDPMHQLGQGNGTQRDLNLSEELLQMLKKLLHGPALTLGFDDDTGVEDQSQEGGSHGF